MPVADKPLVWLRGEVKSPPFSREARIDTGYLLRRLQKGERLFLPHSRPRAVLGPRCHELRINDSGETFRIVHRIDSDAIVIVEVFSKKTMRTSQQVIAACRSRLRAYDRVRNDS